MHFSDLGLIDPLLKALQDVGYQTPSPIQKKAIPPVLQRRDILGCAQTGTGKTAAFALPLLQLLEQKPAPKGKSLRKPAPAVFKSFHLTVFFQNKNTVFFGSSVICRLLSSLK